jgi:hypothetical protein
MKCLFALAALLSASLALPPDGRIQGAQSTGSLEPIVLYWPTKQGDTRPRQRTGLLYTPELLAHLVSTQPPETVPTLISDAVQQQTPIVVMWTIPPVGGGPPWPRPFSVLIAEEGDSVGGKLKVEPVWTLQNADDLRRLDSQTSFRDVGVMAAFPRSAFVPGRLVVIYLRLPTSHPREYKGVQVFGLIDWNAAPPR